MAPFHVFRGPKLLSENHGFFLPSWATVGGRTCFSDMFSFTFFGHCKEIMSPCTFQTFFNPAKIDPNESNNPAKTDRRKSNNHAKTNPKKSTKTVKTDHNKSTDPAKTDPKKYNKATARPKFNKCGWASKKGYNE